MKSWLPTTLLLLYFAYYVFAIQDIELDPWSVGELMTARTLPSIVGIIALLVIIIQIVKTLLELPQSRSSGETRIDKVVQSDRGARPRAEPDCAPRWDCPLFWALCSLNRCSRFHPCKYGFPYRYCLDPWLPTTSWLHRRLRRVCHCSWRDCFIALAFIYQLALG